MLQTTEHGGQYIWKSLFEARFTYLPPCWVPNTDHGKMLHARTLLYRTVSQAPSEVAADRLARNLHILTLPGNCHDTSLSVVSYQGPLGIGDRSCRTDQPLSRPTLSTITNTTVKPSHVWHRLCRWWQKQQQRKNLRRIRRHTLTTLETNTAKTPLIQWQPFVLPFRVKNINDKGLLKYSVTPRWIAYYEVELYEQPSGMAFSNRRNYSAAVPSSSTECVAVGLSTYRFRLDRRLPGWDDLSFGYHSDDGSFFHHSARGDAYGPTFGVGDVVGCGLDYQKQAIFFTLNGSFLNYAHVLDNSQIQQDWFPTVGMDTTACVHFNFGGDFPFCFNLEAMINSKKHIFNH
jgi:hypothetical protein